MATVLAPPPAHACVAPSPLDLPPLDTTGALATASPTSPSPTTSPPAAEAKAEADASTACELDPSALSSTTADTATAPELNDHLPTRAALAALSTTLLLSPTGASVPFSSLHTGPGIPARVLVIFVRHFFCGICQEFLRTLTAALTPASLLALPVPTSIAIVGCGRPELIPAYVAATGCAFPVYADPARATYAALGMARTLALGATKPEYVARSMLAVTVSSFVQSLMSGKKVLQGGDYRQVGGEVLFVGGEVRWVHRMRNTRDHSEMAVLREVLGCEGEEAARRRWAQCKPGKEEEGKARWSLVNLRRASLWGRKGEGEREEKAEETPVAANGAAVPEKEKDAVTPTEPAPAEETKREPASAGVANTDTKAEAEAEAAGTT